MLTSLAWLPLVTLLASGVQSRATLPPVPLSPVGLTRSVAAADTGAAQKPNLLTPAIIAPYAAVDQALGVRWKANPDRFQAALAHTQRQKFYFPVGTGMMSVGIPDYTLVVQQDTAIAAIFTQHHLDPARYLATRAVVYQAIGAAVNGQAADTTQILGKNIAFVQAHRQELWASWAVVKGIHDFYGGYAQGMGKVGQQAFGNRSDAASDTTP